MSSPLRLGFVGAGFMGQLAHLANYARLEGVELVALAEGRPQLARRVADRYGIAEVYPDHKALLAGADVDAVVAIMGFQLHHALVPDILKAGKHLLTEKPICVRPQTARELVTLGEQEGLTYQVGNMKRFDAGARHAREKIANWTDSGAAGPLRYVRCTAAMTDWIWGMEAPIRTQEKAPAYEDETSEPAPEWMDTEQSKRYMSFINFWIHQVNLIRYLIGQTYTLKYASPDGLLLVAESESGAPITLEMNTHRIRGQWEERYTVSFEKGEIELELDAPLHRQSSGRVRVTTEGERGRVDTRPSFAPAWAFHEQARLFVASIAGEAPVLSPAREAAVDLEVAEEYMRLLSHRQTE